MKRPWRNHLFIPDTQIKPGVPLYHLEWIGQYIVDRMPDVIVMAGDWYDLPSLSAWDKGKTSSPFEGRRYDADVQAGHDALDLLEKPMRDFQRKHNRERRRLKEKQWLPEKHVTWGNHENRVDRYVETAGELEGYIGTFQFDEYWQDRGWKTHPFLDVLDLDGVWYSHYFYNPLSGRPWGGMIETRLKNIGTSFSQGHTQTLLHGIRYVGDRQQHGLVAGSCYLHDEEYKGPQGNHHWRGVVVKHAVTDGSYNPMFVDLDWLCWKYEGVRLSQFSRKLYPVAA